MDLLFRELKDVFVIVTSKGVFKQCKVAARRGELFAVIGGGYLRLSRNGQTSNSVVWHEFVGLEDSWYHTDNLGRLKLNAV